MIKISKAVQKKVMGFNESEWQKVNDVHFGKGIKWNSTPFSFKAVENKKIVGLIFGKHESGTIYISNIIVAEEKRRKGVGTKLIQKAEEFGEKFGDHKIWLISGNDYPEDPFFKSLGFKKQALLPDHYFHKDFVVYVKEIK
ncbi:MAG: GNAT family N-acetyltransferase [Patescibacteria group bacterium]|nr:GNAT family N-acetyltransferase [Patescibacteria group bacterium]MDD4610713.1 GNAT family N-acetyltransferase [Patescibacteria group bacterium]